jgi:hypothetical protein
MILTMKAISLGFDMDRAASEREEVEEKKKKDEKAKEDVTEADDELGRDNKHQKRQRNRRRQERTTESRQILIYIYLFAEQATTNAECRDRA